MDCFSFGNFWLLLLLRATLWKLMTFNLTTLEAAEVFRISATTLRRLRKDGVLKPGIHFRAMGAGTVRSPIIWDGEAIDAALTNRSRRTLK